MKPADYLRLIVLPTLAEFLADPADQRRAYLACITAAHLVDHVSRAGKLKRDDVREAVAAGSGYVACCLEIVEGIGNGTKHAGPDRKAAFRFAPGHEQHVPAFALDVPGAGFDEGRWDRSGLAVAHQIADGADGLGSYCIDDCVCVVVRSYADTFRVLLGGVDLAMIAPELDRSAWLSGMMANVLVDMP